MSNGREHDTDDTGDTGVTAAPGEAVGYAEALGELDSILRELESADVDVDRLAERVARAADLIALCRTRIDGARLRIEAVIADLDGSAELGDAGGIEPA